ncbi:hypothetical protein BZG13_13985 [Salinivibrio sp. ML323]|uniref:LPS O-antigen chain length determinant protein WzzB n=1 Tax=Salinivibrio sp. ML323 TaxID=1909474 RepID=UPI0009C452B7|nr:Wzz/FepE/Etk N-terminal domain-containing protein [Salinivibrio sp. ML323]OOE56703.1 hypothetical protein BZG13_13985 [Salinivibrio sp. ML323]
MSDKQQPAQPQYVAPPYFQQPHDDEIDLRELFAALWQGKFTIIACTVVFALAAVAYALMAQEWWSSKAEVTIPNVTNVAAFQQQVNQYQPIFKSMSETENKEVVQNKQLTDLADRERIFQRFISLFNATQTKLAFFNHNEEFQRIKASFDAEDATMEENDLAGRRFYQNWLERFNIERDKQTETVVLSAQSITPDSSYTLLTDYLEFVNQKLNAQLNQDLAAVTRIETQALQQQKKSLNAQAKTALKQEIERTQHALTIAKAANVNAPLQSLGEQDLFPIQMGASAIEAKLNVLKSLKDPSVLEPQLSPLMAKLDTLNTIERSDVQVQPYSVLENPATPLSRDKPKRALIAVLGTLLGGMLGVAIVLVRFAFKRD